MPKNGMPKNGMPKNGLTEASLRGNHDLLAKLAKRSLSQYMFNDPDLRSLLAPPHDHATDLMRYITSCALNPCETIDGPPGTRFEGELGLCPSWRSEKPSPDCRERVSACVLARVNAVNAQVVISMRGPGTSFSEKVPVETQFRENHGTDIRSFQPCGAACQGGDPQRLNCGWEPRYVGQCAHGEQVHLELPGGADPARAPLIRICRGIYGCDDPTTGPGGMTPAIRDPNGAPISFPPYYGGDLIPTESDGSFTCPSNGPKVGDQITGYYSVMLRSVDGPLDPKLDVRLVGAGDPVVTAYPAPEQAVFTYDEGAFYGTIFPDASRPDNSDAVRKFLDEHHLSAEDAMLSRNQYACYSAIWTPDAAMLTSRLCAGSTAKFPGGCFVNPPGPCASSTGPEPPPVLGRCLEQGPTAAPVATLCRGVAPGSDIPTSKWHSPYTTYLNHPCDLFRTEAECHDAVKAGVIP